MDGSFEPFKGQRVCWTAVSSLGHAQHDKRYVTMVTFNCNPGQNVWDTLFQLSKTQFKLTPPPPPGRVCEWVLPVSCKFHTKTPEKGVVSQNLLARIVHTTQLFEAPYKQTQGVVASFCTWHVWSVLNFVQQLPTTRNNICKRTQHVTSNNVCHFAN